MLKRNQTMLIACVLFICAFGIRVFQLDSAPTQNDEQLWLARAYSLVHTVFNSTPEITPLTRIYSDNGNVDVFETGQNLVPEQYPFTIRTEAHHPGVPPTLLIGLSYVFLADGSHPASLNLLSTIVAIKLPNVIIGSLLVVVVYLGSSYLVNHRVGLVAASLILVSPLMIGFSRLARIDMSGALFATCMFFSYVVLVQQTSRTSQVKWAILAGIFAGLGMATIPYAVYIVPIFAPIKILLSHPSKSKGLRRFLPDGYDVIFVGIWLLVYVFAHPNLWANPIAGFGLWLENTFERPHLQAQESHWLYIQFILLTTVPSTVVLMVAGMLVGFKKYSAQTFVLVTWIVWYLLLLSIPSGGKSLKNILQLSVPISILAGIALEWLATWLAQRWKRMSFEIFYRILLVSQIVIGVVVTAYWWPLPNLYVQPGVTITLDSEIKGIMGSYGIKPALDYAFASSPIEPKEFIARSGRNNMLFYLPEDMLEYSTLHDLKEADWLIVLSKTLDNAEEAWYTDFEPSHIVKHRQVELAYMYYLPDFYPREMYDTSSPIVIYDNGIELYDVDLTQDDNELIVNSLWGEQPEQPYGFTVQLFDAENNKVAQGDFLLPTETRQISTMNIRPVEVGEYRVDLIMYDLATASSVGGIITESNVAFERVYPVGTFNVKAVRPAFEDD